MHISLVSFSLRLFKHNSLCFRIEAVNQPSHLCIKLLAQRSGLYFDPFGRTHSPFKKKKNNDGVFDRKVVLHVCFGVVCFDWASIEKVESVLFLFCCLYSAVKRNSIPSAARSTTMCLTCLTSALHACPFLSMKTGYPNNARLNHRLNQNIIGRLSFPLSSLFLSFSPIFSF